MNRRDVIIAGVAASWPQSRYQCLKCEHTNSDLNQIFPCAFSGKARRIPFFRRDHQRDFGIRVDALHLAPVCRYPDLDLRSVSSLHLGRRTERAVG